MRTLIGILILLAATAAPSAQDQRPDSSRESDTVTAVAADSLPPDTLVPAPAPYEVSIERLLVDDMHLEDTVEVFLDSHGQTLAAFALKIGFNSHLIDIVEILPGKMYDSCRWEYFNARELDLPGRENAPRELWQAVALAQMIPDSVQPVCFGADSEISLLRLVVSNEHVLDPVDAVIPIFFYWEDCSDNTLSSKDGNTLVLSRRVYDYGGTPRDSLAPLFPNRTGAPPQCIQPGAQNIPQRRLDLYNGGVEFRFSVELPDSTGADTAR